MDKSSKGERTPLRKQAIAPVTVTVEAVATKINENGTFCGFQSFKVVKGPKGASVRQPDNFRKDFIQLYIDLDSGIEGAGKDIKVLTTSETEEKTKLF